MTPTSSSTSSLISSTTNINTANATNTTANNTMTSTRKQMTPLTPQPTRSLSCSQLTDQNSSNPNNFITSPPSPFPGRCTAGFRSFPLPPGSSVIHFYHHNTLYLPTEFPTNPLFDPRVQLRIVRHENNQHTLEIVHGRSKRVFVNAIMTSQWRVRRVKIGKKKGMWLWNGIYSDSTEGIEKSISSSSSLDSSSTTIKTLEKEEKTTTSPSKMTCNSNSILLSSLNHTSSEEGILSQSQSLSKLKINHPVTRQFIQQLSEEEKETIINSHLWMTPTTTSTTNSTINSNNTLSCTSHLLSPTSSSSNNDNMFNNIAITTTTPSSTRALDSTHRGRGTTSTTTTTSGSLIDPTLSSSSSSLLSSTETTTTTTASSSSSSQMVHLIIVSRPERNWEPFWDLISSLRKSSPSSLSYVSNATINPANLSSTMDNHHQEIDPSSSSLNMGLEMEEVDLDTITIQQLQQGWIPKHENENGGMENNETQQTLIMESQTQSESQSQECCSQSQGWNDDPYNSSQQTICGD